MTNITNNLINNTNEITEEESFVFKKERDEDYLNENIKYIIDTDYGFKTKTNSPLQYLEDYNKLTEENILLKIKIEQLEQKLKKYTNGDNHKRYYEKNKEKIKKDGLSYLKKLKLENPEKIKEYNHNAYIKIKEKKKLLQSTALIVQ